MIDPKKKSIKDILSDSEISYKVPSYQRSYDWGKEELGEFLDDLEASSKNQEKNLFLGNFIFDVSNQNMIEIVDGQQRLTTISLTLIALRDIANEKNEDAIAKEIQPYIGKHSAIFDTQEGLKFELSKNIRDLYKIIARPDWDGIFPLTTNIVKDGLNVNVSLKRQVQKVKPIYNAIKERFGKKSVSEFKEVLKALLNTYVVVINVDGIEDKFAIFERTNARGLDLNIGDLVKNFIFSHQDDALSVKWDVIVNNADGKLPKMLKYNWVSKNGYIMQSKLYRSLKKEINNQENGLSIFVNELERFSKFYQTFQTATESSTDEWLRNNNLNSLCSSQSDVQSINRVYQALNLFKVTQIIPLIYSIFDHYKRNKEHSKKNLITTLQIFEKYHFINNVICGRVANEVEKFYAESAKKIYEDVDCKYASEVLVKDSGKEDKFLQHLKSKKAGKEEFKSQFINVVYYSSRNRGLINYIFDRINNTENKKLIPGSNYNVIFDPTLKYEKRNFNIEHLLNQKFIDDETEEFHSDVIHHIGNLLVIGRHTNSKLPDNVPSKVKLINSDNKYKSNLRYLDKFIDNFSEEFENWNRESIEKRSEYLASEAYNEIWFF